MLGVIVKPNFLWPWSGLRLKAQHEIEMSRLKNDVKVVLEALNEVDEAHLDLGRAYQTLLEERNALRLENDGLKERLRVKEATAPKTKAKSKGT